LEHETLTGDEMAALLRGEEIDRTPPPSPTTPPSGGAAAGSVPQAGKPRKAPVKGKPSDPEPQPEG